MSGSLAEGAVVAKDIKKQLLKAISKELDAEPVEYDGIQGVPPEWVPEMRKREFVSRRANLLSQLSINQLKKYMKLYMDEWLVNDPQKGVGYRTGFRSSRAYPLEIEDDLDFLCHLHYCVSLDEEEGLELLAGKDAVIGRKRRKQLKEFAEKHAQESHDSRLKEWERWEQEADRLVGINPHLARNKSELARRIKENLSLAESPRTIRNRL
jgi:hypothetical protein